MNENSEQNKTIVYEQMIVTFIDILGFKKLIDSKDPIDIKRILDAFTAFKNLSEWCHKTGDPNKDVFNSISVSDCIIRLTRIPEGHTINDMIKCEINVLAHIQLNLLAEHQILFRGGLTFGDVYFSYDTRLTSFFGPAYLRALDIESKFASYPRVVIDSKIPHENEIAQMEVLGVVGRMANSSLII